MKVEKDSIATILARIRARKQAAHIAKQPQRLGNTNLIVRPTLPSYVATLQKHLPSSPPSDIPRIPAISLLNRFYKLNRHTPAPISISLARVQSFSESAFHPTRWHIVCYGHFLVTIIKAQHPSIEHEVQLRYRDSDHQLHWIASTTLTLSTPLFFKQDTLLARFKRITQARRFYMARDTQQNLIPI